MDMGKEWCGYGLMLVKSGVEWVNVSKGVVWIWVNVSKGVVWIWG